MFRDKIREILELVLKAEEKNIYVAYNYDTNTKTLTIITKTKVFGTEIPMSVGASEVSVEGGSIYSYDPKGKAAFAYMALTKEVLKEAE